jgi:hypothetical protein
MSLSDSRSWPPCGYGFPQDVELGLTKPGLPGSWLFFRCPLSSLTPPGQIAALTRCFTIRVGFAAFGRLATRDMCNEAGTGSRFRITADTFASGGFNDWVTPSHCSVSYMANEHLPCSTPFS